MGNRSSVCWRKRFTLKLNAKGKDGTTPLDWAKRRPETADLLRKHGGKTGAELKAEGN